MRVGLYGGSFDPIHRGHVDPVLRAAEVLELDRVLYLPTAVPPHKDRREASARARYVMVELALLEHRALWVSDLEMSPRPTYTVETVERFRRERPDDEPVLLVGADSFVALPTWRRWRELLAACSLGVLTRPGDELDSASLDPALRAALADGRARRVDNPPVDISSTAVRHQLAAGEEPPPGMVARAVLDYARKYRLYR
ncbi:MAG: nicotinate (nicotinamide) nucleotide adenylyltransferase [Acidobacteriota bacterium]